MAKISDRSYVPFANYLTSLRVLLKTDQTKILGAMRAENRERLRNLLIFQEIVWAIFYLKRLS